MLITFTSVCVGNGNNYTKLCKIVTTQQCGVVTMKTRKLENQDNSMAMF